MAAISTNGPNFARTRNRMIPQQRTSGRKAFGLLWALLSTGLHALAQPCSITIDPDTTICQGQTVTLNGPAGFPNYLWSTGALTQDITVGTSGIYTCQVSYPTGNLVTNGSFSGGNTGFTTQFNYNSTLTNDGNYWIGANAATYHPQWNGTGNGQFMLVNAGWMQPGWRFWCQTLPVCPGQTYTISFRAASLASSNPPTLAWFVNNSWTGDDLIPPGAQGLWQTLTTSWTAPAGVTSADFCVQVSSGHGIGNDFGFDDVAISATVVLTDAVQVTVTPLPVVDLGPNSTLCTGQSLVLDAAVPGGTYVWQDGSTDPDFVVNGPGNYNVAVTANGCTASDAVTVNYNAVPVVNLGPDQTLCSGQNLNLNVFQPGGTYTWQDGSNAPSFTVTGPGTYSVTVWANGCSSGDAIDVAYNPTPVVNLGPDQTLCAGDQVLLNVTTAGATYLWQNGSTGATFNVSSAGVYDVDVTVNGCTASDATTVNYNPLPVASLGPDQTLCAGQTLNLNVAQPGATYLWQDGSTGPSFTVSSAGTYSVDVLLNGCPVSDAIDVSYNPLPIANLGPHQTLCAGQTLALDVTQVGATYFWQDGSTNSTFTVSTPGTYSVDVFLNGCTASGSINVSYNPMPIAGLGPDQTLCTGQTLNLSVAQPGASYLWQDGSTNSSFVVSNAGTYSVDVLLNGCSVTDAIDVAYNPIPVVDLGADQILCAGDQVVFDVTTPGATYLWQDGSTGATFSVSSAGGYDVDVTLNGCSASDAVTINYNPLPIASLGPDQTLCTGQPLNLSVAQPGASYLWQDGSTNSSFTVSGTGAYSVDVLLNGCSASDAIDITYIPVLIVDLGVDQTICVGDQLVLDATTPGGTYIWQDGSTGPSFTVTSAGTYSVDVTASNCAASDAITIGFNPIPVVDLGIDQTVCPGSDVTLDATAPGATYLWQDGSTGATFTSDQPGNYSVQVTAGGCTANDAATIQHFNLQTVDLGPDVTLCQGNAATLSLNVPGATYLWSTGGTNNAINPSSAGIYWVDATLNGCTVRDSITVQVTPLPVVDLGADPSVCPGDLAMLDATQAGATYLWNTGSLTPSINEGPGNYAVTVTVNGCSDSDAITINALAAPQVDLGNDTTLCPGEQLQIDALQAGATYLWQDGSTGSTITATSAGNYSVELTDANGCIATDDITVAFASASSIELGNDTTLCLGQQLVLDATLPGAIYLWSTGAQTATLSVNSAGDYSVTVTQGACSVNDAVTVQFVASPTVDLGPDASPCTGDGLVLDATFLGASYLWSTGDQTPTLGVTQDGTYSVTVTNAAGCNATDAIVVTYVTPSSVELGPNVDLCAGQTVTLDALLPGASYEWSTGEQTSSIIAGISAVYWVEVTQGSCSVSDTVTVNVNPAPQIDLGPAIALCPGEAVDLDAFSPGATYLWSTGDVTSSISVNTSNTYSVTVDLNGCTDTDDVTVTVLSPSSVDLGPDLSLCAGDQAQLDATVPGASYLWNTGVDTPVLTATTSGTYWVEVTQGNCAVTDTVVVDVFEPGTVDLGPDLAACNGESLLLDATMVDATYLWDDGSTNATRTVTTSGNYTVQATIGQCSVTDAVDVVFNPLPVFDIGADVALCPQATAVFDATVASATYVWQDGSTAATYTATAAGQISVTVLLNGCDANDNASVSMLAGPSVALGNDTTLCEGASLSMDVGQVGATYLWDDGSTASTRVVSAAGMYSVDVTLNGCTASDDIAIDVFSLADLDLGADVILCPGETATLNAGPAGAYTWNTGATSAAITVVQDGLYWVEVQVAACVARDSVQVTAVDLDAPDLGEDMTVCAGETVVLSIVPGNASIVWSTGSTADAITVTNSGAYTVTLELDGCTATDAVEITMIELVNEIDLGGDRSFCPGEPLVLDATTAGATYLWNDGATTPSIAITTPGTYTVELSGPCINVTASVIITAGDCDPLVFVPNSFTPNADGFNDVFAVSVYGPMIDFSLDIFDRWGERIHSTELPATWDGTLSGQPVQDGVYVYKVRYRARANGDVVAKELIGHVTLLR